jgi:hypothetical protein
LLAVDEPIAGFIILARWQQSGMKVATVIDLRNPGKHIRLRFRSCRFGLVSSDAVEIVFQILIVNFALFVDIT